jgi:quercetin dioxygenase-like cupin family protein
MTTPINEPQGDNSYFIDHENAAEMARLLDQDRLYTRSMGGFSERFELSQLISEQERNNDLYLEFLRVPALSMGLYRLEAGGVDPQQPHTEDEVYYVASGRGMLRVGTGDRAVAAGSIVFVEAGVEHRFHSITEDMSILVFFAPAEYTRGKAEEQA